MFDLDAYLQRIGLSGRPSLAEVHAAHATSIPFEGLDAHIGAPVRLDQDALTAKLLSGVRGGYCFEQNLLLKAALEALGHEVQTHLARVRVGRAPGETRGRTHLLLRVSDGRGSWHADVGFGSGTLLEPIPWGPGAEYEQAGWHYRLIGEAGETVLQTLEENGWSDLYAFRAEPVPPIDIEMSNWWTSTSPESAFVSGFLVSRQWLDGKRLILSDWGELALIERTPGETRRTPVSPAEVPDLLAERFELGGFLLGEDGRLQRARVPRR